MAAFFVFRLSQYLVYAGSYQGGSHSSGGWGQLRRLVFDGASSYFLLAQKVSKKGSSAPCESLRLSPRGTGRTGATGFFSAAGPADLLCRKRRSAPVLPFAPGGTGWGRCTRDWEALNKAVRF